MQTNQNNQEWIGVIRIEKSISEKVTGHVGGVTLLITLLIN